MGGEIVDSIRRWGKRRLHRLAKPQNNNNNGEDKALSSDSSMFSAAEDDEAVEYIERPLDPSTLRPVRVLRDETRGRMAAPDLVRKVRHTVILLCFNFFFINCFWEKIVANK